MVCVEVGAAGGDVFALQLLLVGEGDGVHHEVEGAPRLLHRCEGGIEAGIVGHLARHYQVGAERFGQRLYPLQQRLALIGEGHLRPGVMHGLGDAPGDRSVIGDPHDQAALAGHQAALGVH